MMIMTTMTAMITSTMMILTTNWRLLANDDNDYDNDDENDNDYDDDDNDDDIDNWVNGGLPFRQDCNCNGCRPHVTRLK